MVELFEKSGILSLGSRLRWLSDMVTRDAGEIYKIYGLDIKPKWFPVLYMLFKGTDNSVTGIAKSIGQTHPSVSNLVKELTAAGLTEESKSGDDRRTTLVRLSAKGRKLEPQLMQVCEDVKAVVESIDSKATDRLWNAIGYWERCLDEKSLLARVADERKRR
ncbi:MAG: MarR family transcriptional regulator [Muribaculaceae bacterium]|nr:MarR family transcriptional regulator [Muribaculaceae bacterium]